MDQAVAQAQIELYTKNKFPNGYILHIGGNQWYKNRKGVVELYSAWRATYGKEIDLLLVGQEPDEELIEVIEKSPFKKSIHLAVNMPNEYINAVYSGAKLLLFPSLAEGFGWPIAEAMASGVSVLTTGDAPMTEVGGNIAYYIKRMPYNNFEKQNWIKESLVQLQYVLTVPNDMHKQRIQDGLLFVDKFSAQNSLEAIELFYRKIKQ